MLVVATLDEMFITTFLYRQAHTIIAEAHTCVFIHRLAYTPRGPVAIAMLLDLVIVVDNLCDTSTLVIAVTLKLTTGKCFLKDAPCAITFIVACCSVKARFGNNIACGI